MEIDRLSEQKLNNVSYGEVLKEVGVSTKNLVRSELSLVTKEFKAAANNVTKHATQVFLFGGLMALGILPFIAFLVIGLGVLLGGNYWLSSLIVAVVFALIGGPLAYSAFKKIKQEDINFERTKARFEESADRIQSKVEQVKEAVKGESYEPTRLH